MAEDVIEEALLALSAQEPTADCGDVLVYERILPAVATSVGRVRNELIGALIRQRLALTRLEQIALAVSEAATNAVMHAYVGRRVGPVYVSARLGGDVLTVSVSDHGRGMQARSGSAGAGFGLMLIHESSDSVELSSDAAGTCVLASYTDARSPAVAIEPTPTEVRLADRRAVFEEFLHTLTETSVCLGENTRALIAEAHQACARAERLRMLRIRASGG